MLGGRKLSRGLTSEQSDEWNRCQHVDRLFFFRMESVSRKRENESGRLPCAILLTLSKTDETVPTQVQIPWQWQLPLRSTALRRARISNAFGIPPVLSHWAPAVNEPEIWSSTLAEAENDSAGNLKIVECLAVGRDASRDTRNIAKGRFVMADLVAHVEPESEPLSEEVL